ncbi:MAG: hypothetical protein GXO33_00550 [Epsilonproteobacteria bacterium]|nr:hypothetical protein [Campylobacterota bacterium]
MWLTQGVVDLVKYEIKTKEKIFECNGVEVFSSGYFGKILTADDQALYCEHDSSARHETLAHTAVCTHADPKRVLVIDGGDGAVAHELLKHRDLEIVVWERDETMLAAAEAMGLYETALKDTRVTLRVGDTLAMLAEEETGRYDIVIVNRFDTVYYDEKAPIAHVHRILSEKGLTAVDASGQLFDMAGHKEALAALAENFKIVMPFAYRSMVRPGGEQWLAIGSKFYHPTADVNLQRADLTDGFTWYNSDLHVGQFALPTAVFAQLKDYIKR